MLTKDAQDAIQLGKTGGSAKFNKSWKFFTFNGNRGPH